MRYWLLLIMAIIAEITGTLTLKWASVHDRPEGYIFMLVMIALSYILLSFSIKKIALGVAYALWEGIGIFFITLFSVTLFGESLSLIKVIGLVCLALGIVLIKSGTAPRKPKSPAVMAMEGGKHAVL